MSENKLWKKTDSSLSQTDGSALFVGQSYDLKLFVSVFLNGSSGSATHNSKCSKIVRNKVDQFFKIKLILFQTFCFM